MDEDQIREEYVSRVRHRHKRFRKRLERRIEQLLRAVGGGFEFIQSRTKTPDSFMRKVAREKYTNPFAEMNDITGIRIITRYADDARGIIAWLELHFHLEVTRSPEQADEAGAHDFSYNLHHVIVRPFQWVGELSEFSDLKAEVQIRSLLQHAWAVQSHVLYKAKNVPSEFSRRIERITALSELVDDEFIRIRDEFKELQRRNKAFADHDFDNIPLDQSSAKRYFMESVDRKEWKEMGLRAGLRTVVPEPYGETKEEYFERWGSIMLEVSILPELLRIGIDSIGALEKKLQELSERGEEHLKLFAKAASDKGLVFDNDPLEIILNLLRFEDPQGQHGYGLWIGTSSSM